jgi:hypothetical protein
MLEEICTFLVKKVGSSLNNINVFLCEGEVSPYVFISDFMKESAAGPYIEPG